MNSRVCRLFYFGFGFGFDFGLEGSRDQGWEPGAVVVFLDDFRPESEDLWLLMLKMVGKDLVWEREPLRTPGNSGGGAPSDIVKGVFENPGSDSEAPEQRCRFTNGHRLAGSSADSFKVSMMNKKPSVATMEERRNGGLGVETEEWFALGSQRPMETPSFAWGNAVTLPPPLLRGVSP
ncbi:uncharacterized protein CCOS01_14408 [Colletotrichum costaricense]|uniref:Uncharacterized protein n=1 Tax=Colletotrichum costaricense TaxID=1209916 RepID=A0AAJ0DUR0_9PEZI|nr:uncharacterized protein CCOS01_14408 [Colletotrichum costaricense]KAK1513466.1 hypothetical protein CCOS01_14408 [Colletotrichum costaricense]